MENQEVEEKPLNSDEQLLISAVMRSNFCGWDLLTFFDF